MGNSGQFSLSNGNISWIVHFEQKRFNYEIKYKTKSVLQFLNMPPLRCAYDIINSSPTRYYNLAVALYWSFHRASIIKEIALPFGELKIPSKGPYISILCSISSAHDSFTNIIHKYTLFLYGCLSF